VTRTSQERVDEEMNELMTETVEEAGLVTEADELATGATGEEEEEEAAADELAVHSLQGTVTVVAE